MRANGFTGNPLLVYFDESGQIKLYDGFHRLAILLHLGLDEPIPVSTNWSGIDGTVGKDFPLKETLAKEAPVNGFYQPVDGFGCYVDRPDCHQRLEYLLGKLVPGTVLDIGCSEGFFSRELAKRGFKVTAIDHSPGLVASARYLSILAGLSIEYRCGSWYDLVGDFERYNNILLLSVIHNDAKFIGIGRALQNLWNLNRKSDRLFLEVPNQTGERQWNQPGFPNWDFHDLTNIKRLEVLLGSSCIEEYSGTRSIFLFSKNESNLISVPTKHGFSLTVSKQEQYITPWLLKLHEWEPETTSFVKANLKPGQTFVDVGANAGYYAVLASQLVGPSGQVHAFEPAPDCLS